MSVVTLTQALQKKGALVGLVCLGWEEVQAFVEAAELAKCPAILMVGPGARASMPLEIWGKMLRHRAEKSSAKLVLHLDHGRALEEVQTALDAGFSSVMYDGSALPLTENIKNTRQMVDMARRYQASSEGEIGFVGYQNGAKSHGTDTEEARQFAQETEVDMMAVSVGNVHLQTEARAEIDWARLEILAKIGTPLVIHGGSGVAPADRIRMARGYNVRKFNIGTEIRQVFGASLRRHFAESPNDFDHLKIMRSTIEPMGKKAAEILRELDF